MIKRKVLVLVSKNGKRILLLLGVIILMAVTINAIIYASHSDNFLANKNIILDPGHGGIDSGTTDYSSFFEKDINLQIANKLKKALVEKKATVDMTRDGDYSLDTRNKESSSRHKRDLIARVNQFNNGRYDIFISIHVNRSSNRNAIGPIVLYSAKYPSTELLANCIQDRLNDYIRKVIGVNIGHKAVRSDYYVLINSKIPGIIIETGFISNPKEKSLLMNEDHQSKLVKYIEEGVEDYFEAIQEINSSEDEPAEEDLDKNEESLPSNANDEIEIVIK